MKLGIFISLQQCNTVKLISQVIFCKIVIEPHNVPVILVHPSVTRHLPGHDSKATNKRMVPGAAQTSHNGPGRQDKLRFAAQFEEGHQKGTVEGSQNHRGLGLYGWNQHRYTYITLTERGGGFHCQPLEG